MHETNLSCIARAAHIRGSSSLRVPSPKSGTLHHEEPLLSIYRPQVTTTHITDTRQNDIIIWSQQNYTCHSLHTHSRQNFTTAFERLASTCRLSLERYGLAATEDPLGSFGHHGHSHTQYAVCARNISYVLKYEGSRL